jgi:hypothetical protein
MLDQRQVSTIVSSPPQEEETTFIHPMPQQVVLGHVTLTNDCEEFLQGFEGGIQAYCEGDYERTAMTAQELLNDLVETIQDDTPLIWRLGFIAGGIAGLLNPDIADTHTHHSCVEVLSRKCKVLYPGPDHMSSYVQTVHQAAGIETLPVEVVTTIS